MTFAPMLKHGVFPLAAILESLVRTGEDALGIPWKLNLPSYAACSGRAEFGFLQIRPLTLSRDHQDLTIGVLIRRN